MMDSICAATKNNIREHKTLGYFRTICFFVFVALSTPVFSSELPLSLPQIVQQKLALVGVPESAVGVYVSEVGSSKPIVSVNADVAMNPASVMKMITTYAGLEILGPAYSWQTVLYANGQITDGVLYGDLVIKGYGDPKLDLENFWLLIHRLRQTGLREITGNLVLDHTHYDIPNDDPGAFDGQPYRTYNIIPEALLINYRTSAIILSPQPDNNTVRAISDPLPDSLLLLNNLKLTQHACGDWRNALNVEIHDERDSNRNILVVLNGSYSAQCGKQAYMLGLHDGASYIRDLFTRLWMQQGGLFHGDVVTAEAPDGLPLLKVYQSPPLTEIIRGINKFSNNIAARQLYLTIGTAGDSATDQLPATLTKSEIAIKQWLATKQMNFSELVIENGSGLSRKGRISANHMGQLLHAAFHSPVMPEFIASLPIAAVDGTLRNRFTGTSISGLAHMKTGTLNNVRALAGYMLDKSGQRIIVVIFVNHARALQSRSAMDSLLHWVYDPENSN
jgi:serine-type D-Ala-D-Ala carboxypeptidase/endopeptidase (penicillin-binding protein 4)